MNTKTVLLALIASLTLLPALSARADGQGENISAEEKERAYQILCVPGSEKGLSEKDANEALEFRVGYHQFLRNPVSIIAQYERAKEEGGMMNQLGAAIMIAATCGATDILKADIAARGCLDNQGRPASIKKVLEACAPVMAEMKKR